MHQKVSEKSDCQGETEAFGEPNLADLSYRALQSNGGGRAASGRREYLENLVSRFA